MKKLIILSIMVAFVAIACSKSGSSTTTPAPGSGGTSLNCTTIDSRFTAVVFPIIQNSCGGVGCHNTGSTNGPGALTNYTQIKAASVQIKSAVEAGTMPKNATLSVAQKNAISCWVSSGGLNN